MDIFILIILFIFGLVMGSFLNVVATRYDGERFLFDPAMIGGRSHCTDCGETLRWFELVPLFSFLIQAGRCRRCGARLSVQYPAVELLSGLIFVLVPLAMPFALIAALWVAGFEALLVMTLIDIRLGIIPDEINVFLGVLGIALAIFASGGQDGVVLSRIAGAVAAGVFFAALIAATRGKGMGMGDLKLAIPLGLLFGWPDIVLVLVSAFVIGAIVGVLSIVFRRNSIKGTLPFGPFLALGATTTFFWGQAIIGWYLSLLGIR